VLKNIKNKKVILCGYRKERSIIENIIPYEVAIWMRAISKNISFFQSKPNIYRKNIIYIPMRKMIASSKLCKKSFVMAKRRK